MRCRLVSRLCPSLTVRAGGCAKLLHGPWIPPAEHWCRYAGVCLEPIEITLAEGY